MAKTVNIVRATFAWDAVPPNLVIKGYAVDEEGDTWPVNEAFSGAAVEAKAAELATWLLARAANRWPTRTVQMHVPDTSG